MKNSQWETYWIELKRRIDKEPLPGILGLDLIRGKPLYTQEVLNRFPLQVFGKDVFLRNMLQQILAWDLKQKVPIIFIASEGESGILEEINYVLKHVGEENPQPFLFYARLQPKLSVSSIDFSELFWSDECKHLYVELDEEGKFWRDSFPSDLEKEIKRRFSKETRFYFNAQNPFVYLFSPERLKEHSLTDYAKRLKENVALRIFSEPIQLLSREEAGHIYGPEIYPAETYEKMRKGCYRAFEERRKWSERNEFFGPSETRERLKLARESAKEIPVTQTAFARFKRWNEKGEDYYWFYPVHQSLGRAPYEPPPKPHQVEKKPTRRKSIPGVSPADYDPSIIDIIEDLRPKRRDQTHEI